MEQILNYCLQLGQYDKQGVMDLIHELNESELDAVTAAKWIIGIESREDAIAKIPTTAVHDGKDYKLTKVRFLEGKVYVTYPETNVRYFTTEEIADRYAKTGDYRYDSMSREQDDNHPFRAEYTKTVDTWEYIDVWLDWAKNPNADTPRKACKK